MPFSKTQIVDVPPRSPADPAAPGAQELYSQGKAYKWRHLKMEVCKSSPLKTQSATQRELKTNSAELSFFGLCMFP